MTTEPQVSAEKTVDQDKVKIDIMVDVADQQWPLDSFHQQLPQFSDYLSSKQSIPGYLSIVNDGVVVAEIDDEIEATVFRLCLGGIIELAETGHAEIANWVYSGTFDLVLSGDQILFANDYFDDLVLPTVPLLEAMLEVGERYVELISRPEIAAAFEHVRHEFDRQLLNARDAIDTLRPSPVAAAVPPPPSPADTTAPPPPMPPAAGPSDNQPVAPPTAPPAAPATASFIDEVAAAIDASLATHTLHRIEVVDESTVEVQLSHRRLRYVFDPRSKQLDGAYVIIDDERYDLHLLFEAANPNYQASYVGLRHLAGRARTIAEIDLVGFLVTALLSDTLRGSRTLLAGYRDLVREHEVFAQSVLNRSKSDPVVRAFWAAELDWKALRRARRDASSI